MTPDDGNALTLDQAADQLATLALEADSEGTPAADEQEDQAEGETPVEAEAEDETEAEAESDTEETTDENEPESDAKGVKLDDDTPVTLADGEKTTLGELIRGNLREADYTRKTQSLSQKERELTAQVTERLQRLDTFIETFELSQGKEPDSDQDPIGYVEWVKRDKVLKAAKQERAKAREAAFQQARGQIVDQLKSGTIFPEWKGEALEQGLDRLQTYALQNGYKPEELSQLVDLRLYRDLEKARRWDESQQAKTKLVKTVGVKPKTVKPGPKGQQTSLKDKGVDQAKRRFEQTRNSQDAIDYLTRLAS